MMKKMALILMGLAVFSSQAVYGEVTKLDMVTNFARASYLGEIGLRYVEYVKTATQGEVELVFHEDGDIVPVGEILNAVSTGAVPCAFSWAGFFGGAVPEARYFAGTPFGSPSAEAQISWMWSGGGKEIFQEVMDKMNIVVIPAFYLPRETGGYFNKEINTLDDFQGLKIRMSGWGGEVLKRAGATVTALPGSEIYLALERGRIDAAEYASPIIDEAKGFYNLAKYWYFPGWHQSHTWNVVFFNKDVWNNFSDQQKKQIEIASRALLQDVVCEVPPLQGEALERILAKSKTNIEVKTFPDSLLKELYALWQDVLAEDLAKYPLLKKADDSFQSHMEKMEKWQQIKKLPAGMN